MDPFTWPSVRRLAQASGVWQGSSILDYTGAERDTARLNMRRTSLRDYMGETAWFRGMAALMELEVRDIERCPSVWQMNDGASSSMFRGMLLDPSAYLMRELTELVNRGEFNYDPRRYRPRTGLNAPETFLVQVSMAARRLDTNYQRPSPMYEVPLSGGLLDLEGLLGDTEVQNGIQLASGRGGGDYYGLLSPIYSMFLHARAMSRDLGWLLETCPELVFDLIVYNAASSTDTPYPGHFPAELLARKFRQYLTPGEERMYSMHTLGDRVERTVSMPRGAPWSDWYNPGVHSRPDRPRTPSVSDPYMQPQFYEDEQGRRLQAPMGAEPPPPPRKVFVPVRSIMGVRVQVARQGDSLSVEPLTPPTAQPRQSVKRIRRK